MLDKFLDYLRYEINRSPLTVEAYETDIRQFQEWISPTKPLTTDFLSVTSNDVRAWLIYRSKKKDSPRTLRRKIISLRTFYKWLMKNNLIKHSPLHEIPLPKISKPLPDTITAQDLERVIKEKKDDESMSEEKKALHLLIVELLYSLGLRRAELVGINDADISFSNSEIKVTGKRSKQRIIPVPQKLLAQIQDWQIVRNKNQVCPNSDCPLFLIKGRRITPNQVYRIVRQTLADTSSRKKSPHALRHTFASEMLNGGAEIDSVREFLGHSSLTTTQIYTHISFKDIKKAYILAHPRSNKK